MCWTPDDDKCPNCQYAFVARNEQLCKPCREAGY